MTIPGLGGLQPPPMNAPAAGQVVTGIQPGVIPGIFIGRYVVVFGASGGVFVYNGTPALGNPPIFWATSASTDPYGNAVTPTAGVAGMGQFSAGNTIINASGVFTYSGTPALGNLVESITPIGDTTGTDTFGNVYFGGFTSYEANGTANATVIAQLNTGGINLGPPGNSFSPFPVQGVNSNGAGIQQWSSGGTAGGDTAANIEIESANASGISKAEIFLNATSTKFGFGAGANWDDGTNQLNFTNASSGPFISGESFHGVTLGTNLSGTIRVKLLPWNAVWMDIQVTDSSSTAAVITCGSLPSAAYYPTSQRWFPLGTDGTPTSLGTLHPNVTIPTSGAISIVTITTSTSNPNYSCSVMYPTN
jgi:hypothetical protein